MERGDFYSSTGVYLADVRVSASSLAVEVASPGTHEITFIGTRDGVGGQILARQRGRRAEIARPIKVGYVRAVVTDERGQKAWVQPVFAHRVGRPARSIGRGAPAHRHDRDVGEKHQQDKRGPTRQ